METDDVYKSLGNTSVNSSNVSTRSNNINPVRDTTQSPSIYGTLIFDSRRTKDKIKARVLVIGSAGSENRSSFQSIKHYF